jgi:putative peptidoglycan lipid II flippase
LLKLADRLNQMPLGIFGIALGTAILPMLARHIQLGHDHEAQRLQANAVEIGTLLTLPAAAALAICAPAFVTAFFVGGKMNPEDGAIMAEIVIALVAGLPAYVLVKVFQPAFFSREDTRTPVWVAAGVLAINIAINFMVVPVYGIVGLAGATAFTATLNVVTLYTILQLRGWFHLTGRLAAPDRAPARSPPRSMSALLWWMMPLLADRFGGSVFERVWSIALLVAAGGVRSSPSPGRRGDRPGPDRADAAASAGRAGQPLGVGFRAAHIVICAPAMDRFATLLRKTPRLTARGRAAWRWPISATR